MEISIERTDCISCGLCVGACPEVYRFADDGLAEVYHHPEGEAQERSARAAAGGCPVSIIYVEE